MASRPIRINPFVIGTEIPDKYFCDRVNETEDIKNLLLNGHNIVMKAERRIGKTSLIHHVLKQREISENFDTYYVDIFKTEDLEGFTRALSVSILKSITAEKIKEQIRKIAKSFIIDTAIDGQGVTHVRAGFSGNPGTMPEKTIDEIFDILAKADKPSIVVLDEFQQITGYPEKRVDAMLRSKIQGMQNVRFIFSGSERRMLDHMFNSSTEPFYRSCTDIEIWKIPKEEYVRFAIEKFNEFGKEANPKTVRELYDLTSGYTSYVNQILNKSFYKTDNSICGRETITEAIEETLAGMETGFLDKLGRMSVPSRKLVKGLAWEYGSASVTNREFLNANGITASQAETAIKTLSGKDNQIGTVTKDPRTGEYRLEDKFFEIWLRVNDGKTIENQLKEAASMSRPDPKDSLRKDFPSLRALSEEQKKELTENGFLQVPFTVRDLKGETMAYAVQMTGSGTVYSIPVQDAAKLLQGTDKLAVNGQEYTLTEKNKQELAEGKTIKIGVVKVKFDLKTLLLKKKSTTKILEIDM